MKIKNTKFGIIENSKGEIKPFEYSKIEWANVASIAMGIIVVAYIMVVWGCV